MKIVFKKEPGKIQDLFFSLYFIYNQNYADLLAKFNVKPNKKVESTLKSLSKKVNFESINKDICDLVFDDETLDELGIISFEDMWNYNEYESYLNYLGTLDDKKIISNVIKHMGNFNEECSEEINEIAKNKDKMIKWIDTLEYNYDIKWKILRFLDTPKLWIDDLIRFIQKYIPAFEQAMKKNENQIEEFNQYMIDGINEKGEEFLKSILENFLDLDNFREIYVTTAFTNSISTTYSSNGSKLYIGIGFEFEKTLEFLRGQDDVEICINTLKNISENTRFKILSLIEKEELFGLQLAEKVGVSMATISHHMNYLIASKLVTSERKGQKFYYSINKDTLRNTIEFLNNHFKL